MSGHTGSAGITRIIVASGSTTVATCTHAALPEGLAVGSTVTVSCHKGDAANLLNAAPAKSFNLAVLFAWLIPVGIALYFIQTQGIAAWYFPLPCWVACGILFLIFSGKQNPAAAQ